MNKTFEVIDLYLEMREIRVYENDRRIFDTVLNKCDVNGAVIILQGLGYQLLYRAF